MLRTGRQSVDSAGKVADLRVAGNGTDNVQKFRAVQKRKKRRWTVSEIVDPASIQYQICQICHEENCATAPTLHLPLNLRQQRGFEELFQHHIMICGKVIAQGGQGLRRIKPFAGELQHD